ncbi:MAG: ThuA domain-containing protein [Rubritalea sp.]|jgi:hypothetical protein
MKTILLLMISVMSLSAQITYKGNSDTNKKHIVFVASDHEYRAEETCTALARILAKHHGYDCTVLYGVNEEGEITAGASDIKGLEALEKADLMVIFTRFLDLPDDQMKYIDGYVKRGGPVVGLRTSSHAFKIPKGKTYSKYDFRFKGKDFKNGFGEQILGNTWVGHYGKNHVKGTRIQVIPEQKNHAILTGVKDGAFCYAGTYNGVADESFTVLTNSQPTVSMELDSKPDETKPPVPATWTRHYTSEDGKKARVFHSTQGASEDLLDVDYRRMIVNGIFWAAGDEAMIKAKNEVSFVGKYQPTTFSFAGHVKGVKPEDLQDINSPIMPVKVPAGK